MSALLEQLRNTLRSLGIPAKPGVAHIEIPDGIQLEAVCLETRTLEHGGVQSATAITAQHARAFPSRRMRPAVGAAWFRVSQAICRAANPPIG